MPPVLQKQFWTYKRNIGKNWKSGIVLWSNSIKSTWKIAFFFFLSTKRMLIGSFAQKAFSRCPQYSRSLFGPMKEILEKIENQGLFYGQIQSNQHEILCFFSSFPQKGCILIISFRMLSVGAPPVLQKSFRTYERDIGKNRKSGIVFWSNSIKWTWNKCFFSSFPQKGCILIVSLRRLSIGEKAFNRFPPVLQKQFWTYKRDIGKKI